MTGIYDALTRAEESQLIRTNVIDIIEKDRVYSKSALDDKMSTLYQNILSLMETNDQSKIVQFVGCKPGDGTSTLTRVFATNLSKNLQKSVLLVDADREQPSHFRKFNINPSVGWDEVIHDGIPAKKAIHRATNMPLYFTQSSLRRDLVSHVFDTNRLSSFFGGLKSEFDLILVDSPPATTSMEAFMFSPNVDGIVLVVESEKTRLGIAEHVVEKIRQHRGNVLGVVLNKQKHYIPGWLYKWI